ncbi:pyrBI operon leader peptide [Escherichia coli]|uniref:pyrBI operon leader peptide n=1 Tax=Escherichia coli TaxID=562 RepID=UPI001BFC16C3|nr:pyrBI operon leader peptide [Escherichia coli]MDA7309635.1 pyrBI operon leader peptide [Escherichia coli]MDA7328092.1 pyrBI operon leader peptide [Escherichia coli]MDA7336874.1 pyrBI operon leader peptide [Escherichia coli]MDA7350955.1 pyrBI operon leader peptide [Escherichia coli]MDA7355470.1 pyrBI operon leader peptide [Escherichia coli]
MPDNVPGGSIVKRVRYNVSPRLKSDTGLVFYSRCLIYSLGPSFEGLFCSASGDKHESVLSKNKCP